MLQRAIGWLFAAVLVAIFLFSASGAVLPGP